MTLREKLISIYPVLVNYDFARGEIMLQDDSDGNGAYIKEWNHPTLAQPTNEQLEAL